uniref:Uncharacterized protein n=1 Tax=Anguilla anguilla TaxID=7936 RepID=A0A0E9Q7I3_ANGAN
MYLEGVFCSFFCFVSNAFFCSKNNLI